MADFYENKQVTEEVILVGVAMGETSVTDESLDELEELAKTAGAVMMSYHRRRWPIWRMCWISR